MESSSISMLVSGSSTKKFNIIILSIFLNIKWSHASRDI